MNKLIIDISILNQSIFIIMGSKTWTHMKLFHPVLSGTCLPVSAYPFIDNKYI